MKDDTHKTYQKLKNDLERMVPDSELEYADQDLMMDSKKTDIQQSSETWENTRWFTKNFIVAFVGILIAVLWWFDWNFAAMANRTSDMIDGILGNEVAQVGTAPPAPEAPPIPSLENLPDEIEAEVESEIDQNANQLNMSMSEYVATMQEAGYRDEFSMPALSAFYNAGVEIAYLDQLNEAGFLDELSFPAIITFFSVDVPVDYLAAMEEEGYLEQFNFPGITAFYGSDITVEYLRDLEEKDLLDDLSFSDIIIMHQNE